MSDSFNWTCPHCGRHTTINDDRFSLEYHRYNLGSKHENEAISTLVISCPNEQCREITVRAAIMPYTFHGTRGYEYGEARESWRLIPRASIKIFPEYIPQPLISDYQEACLIRDLSPKASATLARRCLQGMIRDFWGIKKGRLIDEIDGIQNLVDNSTWDAIDAVRRIGNIGAHMEKDINLIVDVDPNEAQLLIELIETLLTEWHVARHEREERMNRIKAAAAGKATDAKNKQP